jgi:uncharacterized protein (TIGR02118 family)
MTKVTVLYPNAEGVNFDHDYYANKHFPMLQEKLGAALKGVGAEAGLAGPIPGTPPAFVAIGYMLFESPEAFEAAIGPHLGDILADVPNYTNAQPNLQISRVTL